MRTFSGSVTSTKMGKRDIGSTSEVVLDCHLPMLQLFSVAYTCVHSCMHSCMRHFAHSICKSVQRMQACLHEHIGAELDCSLHALCCRKFEATDMRTALASLLAAASQVAVHLLRMPAAVHCCICCVCSPVLLPLISWRAHVSA